ncbi:hypothetical protein [Anaerospora hongkongensis]|uniref:hypothetical protein n=1 Tax=Anaerospora hongkongensis TaxID=244830 RepID=UPI0028A2AE05|nr:hypothetical protein [Anaerospora hongkongensis]
MGRFHTVLTGVAAGMLCVLLTVSSASAETRLLPKDAKLHPQGWSVGELVEFKGSTTVMLNQWGEVVTGTLDKDTLLTPRGWNRILQEYYYVTASSDVRPWFFRYNLPPVDSLLLLYRIMVICCIKGARRLLSMTREMYSVERSKRRQPFA